MGKEVRIGITKDLCDEEGKLFSSGPGLNLLDETLEVEYEIFPEFLPEVTPEQIRGFDMVITRNVRWTQRTVAKNDQLLSVHRNGVGYETIDVPSLTNAGIALCITPSAVRRPIATAIITLILGLSTRLIIKDKLVRDGQWAARTNYTGDNLAGKTLGSVGVGNIGHEMYLLAKPFGMRHIAYDPHIRPESVADVDVKLVDMGTVLAESDVLNIGCRLNAETYHLIGGEELAKMKTTAFLINTARGPIVDETALIKALQEGRIRGAGLDVFEQEPVSPDNPLLKMDNVILAPHALGWTHEILMDTWHEAIRQIAQVIQGEVPQDLVNREVWKTQKFQSKLKKLQTSDLVD